MGRGSSKISRGGGGGGVTQVITSNGDIIDLSGMPLIYNDDDPGVAGDARSVIEAWENRRVKNKVEFNMSVDQNGEQIGKEVRGGKGSVRVPVSQLQEGAIHTHIHPREERDILGGTFSDADLRNFADYGVSTYRAKAKEGAYSISKTNGFNRDGFKSYVNSLHSKENATLSSSMKDFRERVRRDSSYTYNQYSTDCANAFNRYLVAVHNGLLSGQKQYGYSYTLERSK